jgi:hypothetical protein
MKRAGDFDRDSLKNSVRTAKFSTDPIHHTIDTI